MLKKLLGKLAGFFAIGWFAASSTLATDDGELPQLPVKVLHKIDVNAGNGETAQKGTVVSVHYTGWLYDPSKPEGKGVQFDSSKDRGQTFKFELGRGRVIQGWEQGVAGMKEGGIRTLIIPPELGYGSRGAGGVIPPNAVLLFDVELVGVE